METTTDIKGEVIARYFDGSGDYLITLRGDVLITDLDEGTEIIQQRLTRAPQFDDVDPEYQWMLTDRFGSCPDFGAEGVVWIDGKAYEAALLPKGGAR